MYLALLASADSGETSGGSPLFTLVFMALIFVAMYFLMIRPQRRRMREAQELQRSMEEGDEVVTNAGVYGFVTAIDGDIVWLEIAENVEIRIARAAIARVIKEVAPAVETANSTDIDEIVDDNDSK